MQPIVMQPIVMRPIILAASVLAVACSDQASTSPTAPTDVAFARARTQAQSSAQLPFRGSLTGVETLVVAPPNLFANGTGDGTASHLGRVTLTESAVVDLATSRGTGTFNFTAANGDQLIATFAGQGVLLEPDVSRLTEVATIVGGTGRFAGAIGSFTMQRIIHHVTGTWSGSFEGHINLNE